MLLGGGFKHFLCLPLLGEMIQFDVHIFQMGGEKPPTRLISYNPGVYYILNSKLPSLIVSYGG